ncbi:hypothetical protein DBR11_18395, partial [Pedobacter sp. HMWF019]|uniref:hypothetical protein n=1 Tax=Pedobacter sp. HMWF019 TaxID=2056856 RepID=UPI000D4704E6
MKHKAFILLLLVTLSLIVCSCRKNFNLQSELNQIAQDNVVTQKEFLDLQTAATKEKKYERFKNREELYNYINKFFTKKKLVVEVWNPTRITTAKFNINVFFENSFSMDGYISQADLKSSIYDMLVNLKQLTSSINLNYINSSIIKASSSDIKLFSSGLTPQLFKKMGGKRWNSDIAEVLENVLSQTDQNNASILISDFVFSPPKKINAVSYLKLQEVAIKDKFQDKLNKQNLALAIFQMKANFQGDYYDHNSKTIKLAGVDRPYYIWFIGTEEQVRQAVDKQIVSTNDPHFLNSVVISSTKTPFPIQYKVINKGKVGNYKFKKSDEISDATADNGNFGFGLAVNFAKRLKGVKYFSEQKIYQPNNTDYSINVRSLNLVELSSPSYSGYTH